MKNRLLFVYILLLVAFVSYQAIAAGGSIVPFDDISSSSSSPGKEIPEEGGDVGFVGNAGTHQQQYATPEEFLVESLGAGMGDAITDIHDTGPLEAIDDQERLDTLVRSFKRLPPAEQQRLGVDLDQPLEPNSEEAKKLFEAWLIRQAELKEAINTMVKPAEFMAQLLANIRTPDGTVNVMVQGKPMDSSQFDSQASMTRVEALKELEAFVDDIDNARDFQVIGGWKVVSYLLSVNSDATSNERGLAAWVLGTVVKNSYDFQLWVLEDIYEGDGESCLNALVRLLVEGEGDAPKNALYAIASASRGNSDVQEALLALEGENMGGGTEGRQSVSVISEVLYSLTAMSDDDSDIDKDASIESNQGHFDWLWGKLGLRSSKKNKAVSSEHVASTVSGTSSKDIEIRRKVWAYMADMLEELHFIQDERSSLLAKKSTASHDGNLNHDNTTDIFTDDDVLAQLDALKPLGGIFCTSDWSKRATLALVTNINELIVIKDRAMGIKVSTPDPISVATRSSVYALLNVILTANQACSSSDVSYVVAANDAGLREPLVKLVSRPWVSDSGLMEVSEGVLTLL